MVVQVPLASPERRVFKERQVRLGRSATQAQPGTRATLEPRGTRVQQDRLDLLEPMVSTAALGQPESPARPEYKEPLAPQAPPVRPVSRGLPAIPGTPETPERPEQLDRLDRKVWTDWKVRKAIAVELVRLAHPVHRAMMVSRDR